ncbi:hypothetical protein ATCC90586_010317 [Pythium insidiosum]|nr:hypothetical protein ATCC90586_010317 [Pythium insidiosum]
MLENPFYGTTKGLRVGHLKYALYGSGSYEVFNLTADPMEKHPIEKGRMDKVKNPETASELKFLDQAIATIQSLYERNAFVPSAMDASNADG